MTSPRVCSDSVKDTEQQCKYRSRVCSDSLKDTEQHCKYRSKVCSDSFKDTGKCTVYSVQCDIASIPLPKSGRSSPTIHGRVERNQRASFGDSNYQRLLSPIRAPASSCSPDVEFIHNSSPSRSSESHRRRNFCLAAERSNRRSPPDFQGVLFSGILCPQAGGEVEADLESKETERPLSQRPSFPDGYDEGCGASSSTRRLRGFSGSFRRLFSHSHQPASSAFSPVRVEEEDLSISGDAIRISSSPSHFHQSHQTSEKFPSIQRPEVDYLLGRRSHNSVVGSGVSPARRRAAATPPSSRLLGQLEEVFPYSVADIPFPRSQLEHDRRNGGDRRRETPRHCEPSGVNVEESGATLQRSPTPARSYDSRDLSGAASPPSLPFPSKGFESDLQISKRSKSTSQAVSGIDSGPVLDEIFGSSPMHESDVEHSPRGLQCGSVDGRVGLRVGNLLSREDAEREMDGCRCPSPYKCEGTHLFTSLPPGLPPIVFQRLKTPVADGQFHGSSLHPETGRHSFPSSPSRSKKNSTSSSPTRDLHPSSVRPIGGESVGGCGVEVLESAGLASSPVSLSSHLPAVENANDRPFRFTRVSSTSPLFCMGQRSPSGSFRRPRAVLGLPPRLRVSASSSPSSSGREDCGVEGDVHPHHSPLARTEMVSGGVESEHNRSPEAAGSSTGNRFDDGPPASSVSASTLLEDYRRLHNFRISEAAFGLLCGNWRSSTLKRYEKVWNRFKEFLSSEGHLLTTVDLSILLEYFSHLNDLKLAYSTVTVHRSVLSMMLPAIDNFSIGEHPTISKIVKGVFNLRPPQRRLYEAWDAGKVFATFSSSSSSSFDEAQRETAFLFAMATSRRPSEIASLKCSPSFMIKTSDHVRFIPSRLSKTDRPSHLGPPILIRRLPVPAANSSDISKCPLASLEHLLRLREENNIQHDYVFSASAPPHPPIDTAGFSSLIRASFKRAGIAAPPGSTRSISVSDAFARGSSVDQVLQAGDWSNARTFFTFYGRPSASASNTL